MGAFVERFSHAYPCLCLCFGLEQTTKSLPFLLTSLHLSHIFFTDALTFMML